MNALNNHTAVRSLRSAMTALSALTLCCLLASCYGGSRAMQNGGEVTGQRSSSYNEPAPFGMVEVKRGFLKAGVENNDTLWGMTTPVREISVDGFWMDQTEVTNSMYRQFVEWVRDSIIRERLADPMYGGDETFKIETDRYGEPVTPHLNWTKPIPWRKPTEEQERAIQSVYTRHPIDGTVMLDIKQLNYRYEVFDYEKAALRKYRLDPTERNLNTDIVTDPDEVVMISKDTAYIDENGAIVRQTIERPLSGPYDFLNTYIVPVYPDTTCWVNDFPTHTTRPTCACTSPRPSTTNTPWWASPGNRHRLSAHGAPNTCSAAWAHRHATCNATACRPK